MICVHWAIVFNCLKSELVAVTTMSNSDGKRAGYVVTSSI